jgi:hypothetical protein
MLQAHGTRRETTFGPARNGRMVSSYLAQRRAVSFSWASVRPRGMHDTLVDKMRGPLHSPLSINRVYTLLRTAMSQSPPKRNPYAGLTTCLRCNREFQSWDRRQNRLCPARSSRSMGRRRNQRPYLTQMINFDIHEIIRRFSCNQLLEKASP